MTTIKFTPNSENKHEYEIRTPVLFSKDAAGHRHVDLQTPVHKVDHSKTIEIKSPITQEHDDKQDGDTVKLQSPIETKDPDDDNKVKVKLKL